MQDKIAHLILMRAQDRLQAAIDSLLRQFYPGQRPANIVDIKRVNDPPARAQQRPGLEKQLRIVKTAAQRRRQPGVEDQIVLFRFAGQLQRHCAVLHAEPARADGQHRVAFAGIAFGQDVKTTADHRVFQPLLPVVDLNAEASAKRHAGEIPVPATVAYLQLLRGNAPRQIQQRVGVITRHNDQLTLVILPVQIGIDQA